MLTKFGEFRPNSAMNSKFGPSTNGVFEQFVDLSLSLEALYPLLVSLCPLVESSWFRQELCEDPETSIVMDLVDEGPCIKPPCREVTWSRWVLKQKKGHFLATKIRMSPTKIWVDRWFMIAKLVYDVVKCMVYAIVNGFFQPTDITARLCTL